MTCRCGTSAVSGPYMNDPNTPLEAMDTTYQAALQMVAEGSPDCEIARKLGWTPSNINRIRRSGAGRAVLKRGV